MDIQYFITFREVSRCQSLTRAAERLGYAQSTVSIQIQTLEKHYNLKLFDRTNKFKLTESGLQLLQFADSIVNAYFDAEEHFNKEPETNPAIGAIEALSTYFLPPYYQAYHRKYMDRNLSFYPSNELDVIRKMKQNELDMGLILSPYFSDPELKTIQIREEKLVIVCQPEHPLSGERNLHISVLQNSSFILTEKDCAYRTALERILDEHDISYQIVTEMGSIECVKQCVMYGMGLALVPLIAVQEQIAKNQLSFFTLKDELLPSFYTQIILHKNKRVSSSLQEFVDILSTHPNQAVSA
ncbi:LysR family transcriptional regulator [Paenibacillus silvestris]|uniref:LysR family transcriptional regulator n=1 Tax=Paenibacillus silvestris TaxID=2606219 RepID=UPI001372D91A|nr:LysR family transcriptional regulator [Paenibacillus silvestris]